MQEVTCQETDHYCVTKALPDNPESYLRHF